MAKVKKAQDGARVKGSMVGAAPAITKNYSVDTTGYAAGKKKFPATIKTTMGNRNKREFEGEGEATRGMVDKFIKGKTISIPSRKKSGGKTVPKKAYGGMMMKKGGKMKKSK